MYSYFKNEYYFTARAREGRYKFHWKVDSSLLRLPGQKLGAIPP